MMQVIESPGDRRQYCVLKRRPAGHDV